MLRVALTHDVDRTYKSYQYLTYLTKALLNKDLFSARYHLISIFKKNPYWNFEEIINLERELNVKSTFFFLNESIAFNPLSIPSWKLSIGRYDINCPKIIDIIRFLDRNGWEIGVHGSYYSYKNLELLAKEKKTLESILGHNTHGVRQHYLNLNEQTWHIHRVCGFKYDASFGYTDKIGFLMGKDKPFRPFRDSFVVFPLPIMDSCFMNTTNRWKKLQEMICFAANNDSLMVINWHQRSFNKNEFPGYMEAYANIIKICMDMNAIFLTLEGYLEVFCNS